MKKSLLVLLLLPLLGMAQPLTGNYVVGAAQPYPFNTLSNAVARINAQGVSGPVVFLLDDSSYTVATGESFPITIRAFAGSSQQNTLTIRPNASRTVTVSASGPNGYTPAGSVIALLGADNVTIDGSNLPGGTSRNLTLLNSDPIGYVNRTVVWIASEASNAVANASVVNTQLKIANRNQEHLQLSGVYIGNANANSANDLAVSAATAGHSGILLANDDFVNVRQGVYVTGNATMKTTGLSLTSNHFGDTSDSQKPSLPVFISNATNFSIARNTITGVLNNNTSNPALAAIAIENSADYEVSGNEITDVRLTTNHILGYAISVRANNSGGRIVANTIRDIRNTGYGLVRGISVEVAAGSGPGLVVANNFVSGVASNGYSTNSGHGIYLASGNGTSLYHNSIAMNTDQNGWSAALYVAGGSGLDVRNNIFSNTSLTGTRYAVYAAVGPSVFSAIDANDYYAQNIGYLNGNKISLADWKAATGQDNASVSAAPVFTSSSNLHLVVAANASLHAAGIPLASVAVDIDGDVRNTQHPDLGADEFILPPAQTIWDGNAWSNGLPTSSKVVILKGNYTVSTDLNAFTLTVTDNAIVSVNGGKVLQLNGALTVESGSLTFQDGAALLQPEGAVNSGNIVLKRTTAFLMRQDYVLWSSPVSAQNMLAFSPNTLTNRFYSYNPSTNLYNTVANPANTNFTAGQATLIRLPNNHPTTPAVWTGTFTGVPNNGSVSVNVVANTYNAVGNPYPSPISADAFIAANNGNGALYFYRKTNNAPTSAYATYTLAGGTATGTSGSPDAQLGSPILPNGTIAVGQGFLLKPGTASVQFTNAMRNTATASPFLRQQAAERHRIWLNLSDATGMLNQTLLAWMQGATDDADQAIDGLYINDSQTALTSLIGTEEYAIQGRGLPFSENDVVPMGFKAAADGTYTISLDHFDGLFTEGQTVFLKDKSTGILHDLSASGYVFVASAGTHNDRFEIVFKDNALGAPEVAPLAETSVVGTASGIAVRCANAIDQVTVFDLSGRRLAGKSDVGVGETLIPVPAKNQVVLVQFVSSSGITTRKVML